MNVTIQKDKNITRDIKKYANTLSYIINYGKGKKHRSSLFNKNIRKEKYELIKKTIEAESDAIKIINLEEKISLFINLKSLQYNKIFCIDKNENNMIVLPNGSSSILNTPHVGITVFSIAHAINYTLHRISFLNESHEREKNFFNVELGLFGVKIEDAKFVTSVRTLFIDTDSLNALHNINNVIEEDIDEMFIFLLLYNTIKNHNILKLDKAIAKKFGIEIEDNNNVIFLLQSIITKVIYKKYINNSKNEDFLDLIRYIHSALFIFEPNEYINIHLSEVSEE
ncbi:MAG: hypothetical protein QXF12_01285 [Candidatus Aenigmatarchaeota archaeon]